MNTREKEIKRVSTGSICLTSNPCQHYVTVFYKDGTYEEKGRLYKDEIVNQYGRYLSAFGHFAKQEKEDQGVICQDDEIFSPGF